MLINLFEVWQFLGGHGGMKMGNNPRDRSLVGRSRKNALEKRVYVSNIPYECHWQDVKQLFRKEVGEVSYVKLFVDKNDKPRGCGIVEFEKPESAQLALEKMHRYELKGRKLVVNEKINDEREMPGRASGFDGRSTNSSNSNCNQWNDSSSGNKWGYTYGFSSQFLESLNINGSLISKVLVENLDCKVDEKKLREVFNLAGRVVNINLPTYKDGKSRGFGTVEFEHPVKAIQAISMLHNKVLFDRRINVRMDNSNERPVGLLTLPEGLQEIGLGLGAYGAPLTDDASIGDSITLQKNLKWELYVTRSELDKMTIKSELLTRQLNEYKHLQWHLAARGYIEFLESNYADTCKLNYQKIEMLPYTKRSEEKRFQRWQHIITVIGHSKNPPQAVERIMQGLKKEKMYEIAFIESIVKYTQY